MNQRLFWLGLARREVLFARRMCRLGIQQRREFVAEFGEPGQAWRGAFGLARDYLKRARESREIALSYALQTEGAGREAAAGL